MRACALTYILVYLYVYQGYMRVRAKIPVAFRESMNSRIRAAFRIRGFQDP